MLSAPNLGIRPKFAEIWAVNQERVCQIILPPATREALAERAVEQAVTKWLEGLDTRFNLRLVTDITVEGPFFCPFLEHEGRKVYGHDLWFAKGRFRATKPRLVREDVVVGARRLAEDAGYSYEQFRSAPEDALTPDYLRTLQFVKDNAAQVYCDLQEKEQLDDQV